MNLIKPRPGFNNVHNFTPRLVRSRVFQTRHQSRTRSLFRFDSDHDVDEDALCNAQELQESASWDEARKALVEVKPPVAERSGWKM